MKEIKVEWRGTFGMGDCMMALNVCHLHAWNRDRKINLEMHWEHEEDYYHHFEEEETLVERMEYIHNFYLHKERVRITHKYNQKEGSKYFYTFKDRNLKAKNRYLFEDNYFDDKSGPIAQNSWLFNPKLINQDMFIKSKIVSKKYCGNTIVIWRPLFNAEPPRTWKRLLTNDDWRVIIAILRRRGLNIVELTYRTPIREVLFHIATCKIVLCYDGMWHYISKNLNVPQAIVSDESISRYHTPEAFLMTHEKDPKDGRPSVWEYTDKKLGKLLGEAKKRSLTYKESCKNYLRWKSLQHYARRWSVEREKHWWEK